MRTDARYFPDPLSFIPERWFSRPELIKDKRAFAPFIIGAYRNLYRPPNHPSNNLTPTGPYNCVGKQLALLEARMVLAHTVWNYEMEFAPGENGSRIINETIDIVILKAGQLDLVFRKRE
jgi:cytochrome P450 family 628